MKKLKDYGMKETKRSREKQMRGRGIKEQNFPLDITAQCLLETLMALVQMRDQSLTRLGRRGNILS